MSFTRAMGGDLSSKESVMRRSKYKSRNKRKGYKRGSGPRRFNKRRRSALRSVAGDRF